MNLRHAFIAAAMAASVFLLPAPVSAAGKQNFTLTNDTGYTISEVYVSPRSASDWQEDVMGQDTLDDGDSVEIEFTRGSKGCIWDLKVVYDDDTSAVWDNFNLCTISKITVHYNEKTDKTSATYE